MMNMETLLSSVSLIALAKPALAFIPMLIGIGGSKLDYQISRSLRCRRANSAYMTRVYGSAGNRKTGTWSAWIKLGDIDTNGAQIFTAYNNTSGSYTLNEWCSLIFKGPTTGTSAYFDWICAAGGSIQGRLITNQLFRDNSAWYHVVINWDTTQATASNRMKMYVNGVQITSFSTATYPSQNVDFYYNSANMHSMGITFLSGSTFSYYDGYIANIHSIDGQALDPTYFGEFSSITGSWGPKKYAGTYGTNGFNLDFSDNSGTGTTALGADRSGASNNWTLTNYSVTAGVTNDSLTESPTNYGVDTGLGGEVRGNFCTWNPVDTGGLAGGSRIISNGNLTIADAATTYGLAARGTHHFSSGKWYWEINCTNVTGTYTNIGVTSQDGSGTTNDVGIFYQCSGYRNTHSYSGNEIAYGTSYTTGDVIGVALDCDGGQLTFYKNGVSQGAISITAGAKYSPAVGDGANSVQYVLDLNAGQRPFSYAAPSGYKALCTQNFPDPTIKRPSDYADVSSYSGSGSTVNKTGIRFQPDLLWFKDRTNAQNHKIVDSVRGASLGLSSNTTGADSTDTIVTINSDGFSLATGNRAYSDSNADSYISWLWKKGSLPGLDIVSYTGDNSANKNISHSLGVAPAFAIVKRRGAASNWWAWHKALTGATYFCDLNNTAAQTNTNTPWGTGNWSSTQFMVTNNATENANAVDTYIAYLFAEVEGFSKFGSYGGNGSTDGVFVWCGFKPKFILIKRADTTSDWMILDSVRDPYNSASARLLTDTTDIESSGTHLVDFLSNGFKLRNTSSYNASGGGYIFAAFADVPFKYARAR